MKKLRFDRKRGHLWITGANAYMNFKANKGQPITAEIQVVGTSKANFGMRVYGINEFAKARRVFWLLNKVAA